MALQQKTNTDPFPRAQIPETRVRVDFPELPKVFGQHQREMDRWYESLKEVLLRNLDDPT